MKIFIVISACLAAALAFPLDVYEDENGDEFVLVPAYREKRDVTWIGTDRGFGLEQKASLFNSANHQFDGSIGASKAWGSHGLKPDSFGGRLNYANKPTGSTGFVSATRTPGWGTDVNAGAKYNIVQGKNFGADITGQYGRHFGGPIGTGKPEGGVFLNAEGKF